MDNLEEPQIYYFPVSIPAPISWKLHQDIIDQMLTAKELAAIVLQAGCSGNIPSRLFKNQAFSSWVPKIAKQVPTFIIPDAPQEQYYPWRMGDWSKDVGCHHLETAYSGIADQVVLKMIKVFKATPDKEEAIQILLDTFKQRDRMIAY